MRCPVLTKACGAICLRASCASIPGTKQTHALSGYALPTRCPVLTYRLPLSGYAKRGTELRVGSAGHALSKARALAQAAARDRA
eukprot:2000667-Rhodomonas_salina.5